MQVRLSGLRGQSDVHGKPLAERVGALPDDVLAPFAPRLRAVELHVRPDAGDPSRPSGVRVAARSRRGDVLTATARGTDPESAARRALTRVRRLLRRASGRALARRTRV